MTEKEKKKESGGVSRREFLKDAGLLVGGTAIGSTVLLAACGGGGEGETVTATKTVTGAGATSTKTITTTEQAGEVTKTEVSTVAETVSKFVCPICSQEFGTLAALKAHFETAHASEAPAALNVAKFTVNGREYELQVEPNWTLQDMLREKLGFMSPKDMCCGNGACGSCSVIMNGRPILSCMMLAIECDGSVIETTEGMLAAKHPLIEMYVKHAALQCGYCTPGFVVTAKALLDRNPTPTEADIREALGGNICRCGSYPAHIPAVLEAAQMLGGS